MVKVLVVDDEVPIRQWLEFCISRMEGYQVAGTAANGAEGYSIFRKTMPDIVITDIRMPVMDGLEMLKLIQNLNPAVSTVVLTSHEDFEYARQAMKRGASEYILKTEITEEGLRQLLDKARAGIFKHPQGGKEQALEEVSNRNHYLRSLVLSRHTGAVTEAMLKEYGIFLERTEFVAIDVMTAETDLDLVKVALPETGILSHVIKVPLDLNHIIILGNISRDGPKGLGAVQEQVYRYCRELSGQIDCCVGCSDIYGNLGKLGEAMRQAHERVKLGFYHEKEKLFATQAVGRGRITNGEKYKILFSKELVNQNYQKAIRIKEDMMAEARREEVTDIEYLKKLYLFFLTSLFHITRDNVEKVEEQLAVISQDIMNARSLDKLDQVMNRGFEIHGYSGICNEEYSAPIRNAVRYMEEHYPEPLALTDVAGHVGLSAEYLSRLFKEETGVKFVVYLNNLRLKHALRLLETTSLKVYEVAEQVGYSNLSYFSTVFKKNFGQNPFDYKNSCKNSSSGEPF